MRCQFSGENSDDRNVSLDGRVVHTNDIFRYLGLMLQSDGEIDENVSHRIRIDEWNKDKYLVFSMTRRSQIN
jgi:hypothetical protein